MPLYSWHILQLRVVCSLILFTIRHGNFYVHFLNVLLFTRQPGMGRWFLCTFKWAIYYFIYKIKRRYRYCQSPNRSKQHYSKLTSLFPLLLMWCSGFPQSGKKAGFFSRSWNFEIGQGKIFFWQKGILWWWDISLTTTLM